MKKIRDFFKNNKKEKSVIYVQIALICMATLGGTFALRYAYQTISASLTTASISVVYVGDEDLTSTSFIPIEEEDVLTDALSTSFTVKGAENNPNIDIIYDVSLKDINIGNGLISEDFKWKLYKNGALHSSGDFSGVGTINGDQTDIYERAVLTDEVQRLPKYSEVADSYTLYVYVLETGELQTEMMGQRFSATINIDTYTTKGGTTNRDRYTNLVSTFKPNAPELADGMIPIKYNGTNWVKADLNNTDDDWYNYQNKKWANAVMVSDNTIKDKSENNNNGIIHGNPTITNNEITLDGVDDYIDLGMANKTFSTNITMVARIKMLNTSDAFQLIMGNPESGGCDIYFHQTNKFRFECYDATTSAYKTIISPLTYEPGTWHTVVGRYNGTEESLWIDGTKVISQTISIVQKQSPVKFLIGCNPNSSSITQFGNLTMSDAMVYERALSDGEITTLSSNIANYPKSASDNLLFAYDDFTQVNQREVYMNANNGTIIPENDILAYYVWIPRYKYRLFNTAFTSVNPRSIDVVFENNTTSISDGTCNGIFNSPTDNCYYSHPAFWWDDNSDGIRTSNEELEGIWVGKFEASTDIVCTATSNAALNTTGTCNRTDISPRIKPGVTSWRGAQASTFFGAAQKIHSTTYLTQTGVNQIDSHMMKNIEWGVVAYLSHSKYGKNSEVDINNNGTTYYTGGGSSNAYKTNVGQSTTGNITGIYDMSGNAWEYVMGNYNNTVGSSGFDQATLTGLPTKYIDRYQNPTNSSANYLGSHLGDALGETVKWHSDYASFVIDSRPWFALGGYYNYGSSAGLFTFSTDFGDAFNYLSFRPTMVNIG